MPTLLLTLALLHPVHATYAEIEWNADAKVLEVSLRLDPLDEQTIDKMAKPGVGHVDHRREYLAEHLQIERLKDDEPPATGRYRWIGREEKSGYVWWYVEIKTRDGKQPRILRNDILLSHDQRYHHDVLLLGTPQRMTLRFSKDKTQHPLNWHP